MSYFHVIAKLNSNKDQSCMSEYSSQNNMRLVHASAADGLRREPSYVYLDLDPAPPESESESD
jgi:hypothetical protein